MQLAGIPLGTKYDHHAFMELVEHLAVLCSTQLTADKLGQLTPSLGIPSHPICLWFGTVWSFDVGARRDFLRHRPGLLRP